MKNRKPIIFALMISFFVVGCTNETSKSKEQVNSNDTTITDEVEPEVEVNSSDEESNSDVSMWDFFLADNSKAHFKGEGNEFAEKDIEVRHPYDNYIVIHESNGGAVLRQTFKVGSDKIEILEQSMYDFEKEIPTLNEIQAMQPIDIYLQKPFIEGATFGDWTVIQTEVTVDTPYKSFDNAFVIEKNETDSLIRKYFVQGIGEVKNEFFMKSEGEEFIVTSTLESIQ
jgi:hypothetical protein